MMGCGRFGGSSVEPAHLGLLRQRTLNGTVGLQLDRVLFVHLRPRSSWFPVLIYRFLQWDCLVELKCLVLACFKPAHAHMCIKRSCLVSGRSFKKEKYNASCRASAHQVSRGRIDSGGRMVFIYVDNQSALPLRPSSSTSNNKEKFILKD
jgi:hypothetical protein